MTDDEKRFDDLALDVWADDGGRLPPDDPILNVADGEGHHDQANG